jgi:hypothetical protein
MTDLFASLILRSSGHAPLVRPQIAPLFAPPAWIDAAAGGEFGEADAPLPGPRGVSHRRVAAEAQAAFSTREDAISVETMSSPRQHDPGPLGEEVTAVAPPRASAAAPAAPMRRAADVARPDEEHHQREARPDRDAVRPELRERREAVDLLIPAPPQAQEARRPPGQPAAPPQVPAFPALLEDAAGEGSKSPSGPLRVAATERSAAPPAPGQPVLEVAHKAAPGSLPGNMARSAPAASTPPVAPVARGEARPAAPTKVRGPVAEGPGASAVITVTPVGDVIAPQPAWSRPGTQGEVNVALPVGRDAAPVSTPLAGTAQRSANGAPDAPAPVERPAPVTSLMPVLPDEANARDDGWVQPAARGQLAAERQRLSPAETASPVVHVTIGRVEVRMVGAQATPATRQRPTRAAPQVTLEEYLRRRDGAGA